MDFESKADSLLKLMTLEEKVGQMCLYTSDWDVTGPSINRGYEELIRAGRVGAIFNAYTTEYVRSLQKIAVEETRLGIPLLFGYDVIHGHRTIFPIPLGQSASWDTASIRKSEQIAAAEAMSQGINWVFTPMVDIARDPRWGRVSEGSGEDTWLGSIISATRVKGLQHREHDYPSLLACVKHFAAYGAAQAGRDYHTVDMSERSLREWYLPPYKSAIDAGVATLMTSFNEISGVPSTANQWLLTDLLRNEWKFKGFVVSDYTAIEELIKHGVAKDLAEAGRLALKAGVDMDMQDEAYQHHLAGLVQKGDVNEADIDRSVKRILIAKYKLGLFDDPYLYCNPERERATLLTAEHRSFARKFVSQSCVLLKNENQTLPLPASIKSVALIGPLGDSKVDMLGNWSAAGRAEECVTLLEGLGNNLPESTSIKYVKGCEIDSEKNDNIDDAVRLAASSDYVILALGEGGYMSGEASSRSEIGLPGLQEELALAVLKTGKPVAVVLFNGRPLSIPKLDSLAPAILVTWFGGTEAGNGIADVLTGKYNPSGKLTMTFPLSVGQIPVFYNEKSTGRPIDPSQPDEKYKSKYLDIPNAPLYPFGYGLSYTTFEYSPIAINDTVFREGEVIIASVDIKNTGKHDGEEIVQLYVRDLIGDVTRPLKELKGFQKIMLTKGQATKVTFTLTLDELAYYHQDMHYGWDPGEFELFIGASSDDTRKVTFTVR